MDQQIKEMATSISSYEEKKLKLETELKASIDKIFDLRDIISELEKQVELKSINEHVLNEKVKVLETYLNTQNQTNDTLQEEMESLKTECVTGYQEKIHNLEEQLRILRPSAEQTLMIEQIAGNVIIIFFLYKIISKMR